jgi:hypothetical protein
MDPDQILRKMDIPELIGLVHQILHLIEEEPRLSKRVFRAFGYSTRHVKIFVENLKEELDMAASKESLIDLIKTVYSAPFIREIKRASVNPTISMIYEQMPNVANTNIIPAAVDLQLPEPAETPGNKRLKEWRPTLTGLPYSGRPSFANMPPRGGRRTRRLRRRKGSRLRRKPSL